MGGESSSPIPECVARPSACVAKDRIKVFKNLSSLVDHSLSILRSLFSPTIRSPENRNENSQNL
jgi:hypothetical protein